MKLKILASMLPAAAFLMACGETVTNINDEAKEKGNITLQVVDPFTNKGVSGVNVYSIANKKTAVTDTLGLSVWNSNAIGTYAYEISKDGYATRLITVTLAEQGQGNVARVGDEFATVALVKADVQAKGVVLYTDVDTGNLKPAIGANVYAKVKDNSFVPGEFVTKTDATGAYAFTNLPEGVECEITIGQTAFNGKLYEATVGRSISGARSGNVVNLDAIQMSIVAGKMLLISDNLDAVDSTTSLTLTFSSPLKADSVSTNSWRVTKGGTASQVLIKAALNADGKTLIIAPFSGKWDNGSSYTISGTAYSAEGATMSIAKTFTPGKKAATVAGHVTNLKAVAAATLSPAVTLSWDAPVGTPVSSYKIFYKTDITADYKLYSTTTLSSTTISLSSFNSTAILSGLDYKAVAFVVLPVNSAGQSPKMETAVPVNYVVPAAVPEL